MSEASEKTFFDQNGVTVTTTRFVVPAQTFAMAGITSVRFFTEKPSVVPVVVAFALALLALASGGNIWTVAAPAVVGVLLFKRKPTHHVVLAAASGESRALQSKNREFIAAVINALSQAIIARG
jgi:hypothetical protein